MHNRIFEKNHYAPNANAILNYGANESDDLSSRLRLGKFQSASLLEQIVFFVSQRFFMIIQCNFLLMLCADGVL